MPREDSRNWGKVPDILTMAAFGEACNSPLPSSFIGLFSILSSLFDAGKKSTQSNMTWRLSVWFSKDRWWLS